MTERKRASPLKIGLLIVALAYFLFNAHTLFTLQWVGEWNRIGGGSFSFAIMLEDITSFVGVIFRFIAGFIAVGSVVFYFSKGLPSTQKTYRILKLILVFEAIYWLTLIPTAGVNVYYLLRLLPLMSTIGLLNNLAWTTLPSIIEAIAPPVALIILAAKLGPNKPFNKAIKWALISGAIYVVVFWLVNTSLWVLTVESLGTKYLTSYPENLLSYIVTLFGMLVLAIYAGIFAWRSRGVQTLQELNFKAVGGVITALGMYFLWNYLTWIFFGGDYLWSTWYAWFLGHNMDLWMLSLPLVGLPLLFYIKPPKQTANVQ